MKLNSDSLVSFFKETIVKSALHFDRLPAVSRFKSHNLQTFGKLGRTSKKQPIVLVELNQMQSAHIAYSYIANVLAKLNSAEIIGYVPVVYGSQLKRLAFKVVELLGLFHLGIYQSFGVKKFFLIRISDKQKQKAHLIFDKIVNQLADKRDIEALSINGILVGDLIYDSYLMSFKKPTIDKSNPEFINFLRESIELFVFWEDYFDMHDVRAINVSHCVYNVAIPLRIAIRRNIAAFQTNLTHVYRLSDKNRFAYNDYFYFPEFFASLPKDLRLAGLEKAKSRLERRFSGEVGVDMPFSKKSAFAAVNNVRLLRESNRKKVLIASHCFFDSPHSFGNNIFPDMYEWLNFLGEISELTDYDWYIKTHPDYLTGTFEIITNFIEKYPKFTLLPADSSHHQIIAEGIDFALTVYGTIGFEYATLGIPVINHSLNNPHVAYDFNLHPKNVEECRRILMSLDDFDFKINKQQVYEYYFMRFIYNTENMFFNEYKSTVEELGGYSQQFTNKVYDKWLEEWSLHKHNMIVAALQAFIKSGDFRMNYRHYGRELSAEDFGVKS